MQYRPRDSSSIMKGGKPAYERGSEWCRLLVFRCGMLIHPAFDYDSLQPTDAESLAGRTTSLSVDSSKPRRR